MQWNESSLQSNEIYSIQATNNYRFFKIDLIHDVYITYAVLGFQHRPVSIKWLLLSMSSYESLAHLGRIIYAPLFLRDIVTLFS